MMCEVKEFSISDFELNKNYVIEASAGTGKTYTIIDMVKKLLENGITLDKILIVTYTEKAAGELKGRIRKALAELPENITMNVQNNVDNASIGTIHSFCQNIISEFFVSAGKPSCRNLINEDAINIFLRRYIREGEIYREICELKKRKIEEDVETKLIKTIASSLNKYYLDEGKRVDKDIVSFDEIERLFYEGKDITEYPKVSEAMKRLSCSTDEKATGFISAIDKKTFDFDGRKYRESSFKDPLEKVAFGVLKYYKDLKIKDKYNKPHFKIAYKYLPSIYIAWQKEKENRCAITYDDMIRDVREEVKKEDSALLKKIREKYRYAIIDEFQDTNRKQWDIFRNIFLTEGHNLIVVGDPKQSIFSFQGADLTVYYNAREEIKKNGLLRSLTKNFRATQDIIHSTNCFFKNGALPGMISFEDSEVGNKDFKVQYDGQDVAPFWITEDNISVEDYAKIVCNRILDWCSKKDGKTKLQIWDKDHNQRNVSLSDFALVARTHSEMEPFINAFEKSGIPYTKYKDVELFAGKECAHWISLLEAVNIPDFTGSNRASLKKAMLTVFFGYSLNDLSSPYFDREYIDEIKLFFKWKELKEKREWSMLIERIYADTEVAEKLRGYDDIKTFGRIMQIGDYCVDYLNKTNNLEMLIANLKKQAKKENDEEDEEKSETVEKATDEDCVDIMTIHASKGLEFPVVISVAGHIGNSNKGESYLYHKKGETYITFANNDTCKADIKEEQQRLFYVAYTRAKYLLMLPDYGEGTGLVDIVNKPIKTYKANGEYHGIPSNEAEISFDELKKKVNEICKDNDIENKINPDDIEKRISELKEFDKKLYFHTPHKHAYSSLSHGGERKNSDSDNAVNNDENIEETEKNDTEIIENDRLVINNEEETESSGLSDYDTSAKVIPSAYDKNVDTLQLSDNFIAGTGLGNALHRVFELIDYTKENDDIDDLIKNCFAEEKIRCKDNWIIDVKNMVKSVVNALLPEIKGAEKGEGAFSLKEIAFCDRKNEVEFNFSIPSENDYLDHYMNGFVDLIFKRGEYYSILDWKSDRLSSTFLSYSDLEEIKKHVDDLYSIQRVLYSYCLIKWLKQFYKDKSCQEIFEEHFGGVYYVFLRGCNPGTGNGIYAQTWESFSDLEEEYNRIVKKRVY